MTIEITVYGLVQGVGFRPFVACLASRLGICGTVQNLGGFVCIRAQAETKTLEKFCNALEDEVPLPAQILHAEKRVLAEGEYTDFHIIDSEDQSSAEPIIFPADLGVCKHCLQELDDPNNRRYRHPFISCAKCGPRYTIVNSLPYDRMNTTMRDFSMCSDCEREYLTHDDLRLHAQTISCHACGPQLLGHVPGEADTDGEEALTRALSLLNAGKIIAVKSVGGYHLMCDPNNNDTVLKLRQLKQREEKPFALLFENIESVRGFCKISSVEEKILTSPARPIVLLERIREFAAETCKTSRFTGVMLPGTGLHKLLCQGFGGPLIATSANLSDRPLISEDNEAFALLKSSPLLSGIFYNTRVICAATDDSVVSVTEGSPRMIRRSRGYAPIPLYMRRSGAVLALGGHLKSSFCLTSNGYSYMSPCFGDLTGMENQEFYVNSEKRMESLFRIHPELLVCDMHPRYFTTEYAETRNIPILAVQHHHAHAASVIAEHGLTGTVLGVCFDGTGYGTDGAIWGGEFLLCEGSDFRRIAHLSYTPLLGGDDSIKQSWKTALCFWRKWLDDSPDDSRWPLIDAALQAQINTVLCSSMGRLFDAVSAILGICTENRYEGECAIMLENAAAECKGEAVALAFSRQDEEISPAPLLRDIIAAKASGHSTEQIALGFHLAVADMIAEVCSQSGVKQIVLSGGVFQNRILTHETLKRLRSRGMKPYLNSAVPCNDGGIALGQAYLGLLKIDGGGCHVCCDAGKAYKNI